MTMPNKESRHTTWLSGWGKDRKRAKRLERRIREREALKQEKRANGS